MDYLSVKELAELKGCQPRYIQKLIKDGKLASKPQEHPQNHKTCYMIPITALPEELQLKYYQRKRAENGVMPEPAAPKKQKAKRLLTFENCTAEQRKSINLWTAILPGCWDCGVPGTEAAVPSRNPSGKHFCGIT